MMDDRNTNNPWKDNWDRTYNKRLKKTTISQVRVKYPDGAQLPRRRKKNANRIARNAYAKLVDNAFRHQIELRGNEKDYYLKSPVK